MPVGRQGGPSLARASGSSRLFVQGVGALVVQSVRECQVVVSTLLRVARSAVALALLEPWPPLAVPE